MLFRSQGLIFTGGNLPSRITKDEETLKRVREELVLEAVETFVHSVQSINIPLDEALNLVKEKYETGGSL